MRATARGPLPWLAFLTCCGIWGSTFLFIRMSNDGTPPVLGAALRLALAAGLFALLGLALRRPWPGVRGIRSALGFGTLNFGVSLPLLYWGQVSVPSGFAAIFYGTMPLTTALFARALGLEPLRPRIVGASLVALGGVTVLVSSRITGAVAPLHMAAVAVAATTAGISGVLLKRAEGFDPFTGNALAHGVGAVVCLLASHALGEPQHLPQGAASWPVIYLVTVGSIGACTTFTCLISRWPVTRISFSSVIIPVVALGLGMLVMHERPGTTALVGAGVILGAVLVGLLGDGGASARERR
ncbi:MAG: DMT family transporter [bacterium]